MRALVVFLVAFLASAILVGGRPARAGKAIDGAVNLNTAPPEVLALLPGIGPAKAQSILAYRKRHPFRTVDELVRIKGIGRKMVRRLRAHLAVGGPTTAMASAAPAVSRPVASPPAHAPPLAPAARPKVALFCARPFVRPRPSPPPRVPRGAGGACWPAP